MKTPTSHLYAIFKKTCSCFLAVFLSAEAITISSTYAIEIANDFTYAGTNGFAASHALATDFLNYPVFEAVGILNIHQPLGDSIGTATLLNSEWVLTAGHNWGPTVTNLSFYWSGDSYAVDMSSRIQHPLWTNAPAPLSDAVVGQSQGWDIALFKLSTPITNTIAYPKLYTKSDELGKIGVTVGGGDLGTGTIAWHDQTNDPPLLHAAFNAVDRTTTQTYTTNGTNYGGGFIVNDFDSGFADENMLSISYTTNSDPWLWDDTNQLTELDPAGDIAGTDSMEGQILLGTNVVEGATAPGDSGGPTFIEDDGEWKLAGVTSWGDNPWDLLNNPGAPKVGSRGLYGDVNYMTRVSQTSDWIYSVIPEPSTYALLSLMLGVFLLTILRRRANPSVSADTTKLHHPRKG